MSSPAQRHWVRMNAPKEDAPCAARVDRWMQVKLANDRQRLKAMQSLERKITVKREILPDYVDYIEGVLKAGRGKPDDILTTIMVWRIDVGDCSGALAIAAYALRFGLVLPEHYARTLPTLLVEEMAGAALKQQVPLESLIHLEQLTANYDMPDPVRAKLHKALGLACQAGQPEAALAHWRRAQTLHAACGVKQLIRRLERQTVPAGRAAPVEDRLPPHALSDRGSPPVS